MSVKKVLKMLSDEEISYRKIIKKSTNYERWAAIEKINDEKTLMGLAENETSNYNASVAVSKIHNQEFLKKWY